MKTFGIQHLLFILLLSANSATAHALVDHEFESCKVCHLSSSERTDLDSDEGANNHCYTLLIENTAQTQIAVNSKPFGQALFQSFLARGPPKLS